MVFNPYRKYLIFNMLVLILYVSKLSDLYNPNMGFILYYFTILLFFLLISMKFISVKYIYPADRCLFLKTKRKFIYIVYFLFFIGVLANIWQIVNYGMPLFYDNKIDRKGGEHYVQYLVNFLIMASSMSYVGFREKFCGKKKMMALIFVLSFINLFIWLNRGAFTLQLITIFLYEYIKAKKDFGIKKIIYKIFFASVIFLTVFAYVGNVRTEYVLENIFHYSINEHYKMDESYPSWFVWTYIYLTSPLENISQIIERQEPYPHTLGMRMFYPFVAPIFKIIFDSPTNLNPPLDNEAGLNVSTYMVDAITDFGFVGPYVYMIYLVFILRLGQISLKKGVYGILTYASALNIACWLSFANAFAIGPFMIAFLFFLFMAWGKDIKI